MGNEEDGRQTAGEKKDALYLARNNAREHTVHDPLKANMDRADLIRDTHTEFHG